MNQELLNFLNEILRSDLRRETREEIIRFFTLPRNTPVKAIIEQDPEKIPEEIGALKRPGIHDLERKADPQMAQEEDAMKETLAGKINGDR